jgi:hypothetical protein
MIEPVLMERGSHIGPITATVIVAIGSMGAPATDNQHYRGPQPRHRCGPKDCCGNLSPYKRAVDSNAGQALASGRALLPEGAPGEARPEDADSRPTPE